MDLNAIEADLFAATDALWPDSPDVALDEPTQFAMHDRLVQYIAQHYTDPCVRDALIFSTDAFFADPALLARRGELLVAPNVLGGGGRRPLTAAERRGLGKKWKHFVRQATKAATDVSNAVSRELGHVLDAASGILTEAVCAQIGAAAAGLTSLPAATAPAAPYVGSAVYFWCLDKADKEVKKAVAKQNVQKWKSGGAKRPGHHHEEMIEMRPGEEVF